MHARHGLITLALIALTTLFLLPDRTSAQEVEWINRMSASFSFGNDGHVDPAGNFYVTGFISGRMDFGGTNLTGAGLGDFFIAKYDTDRRLKWAKLGTSAGWNGGRDIDVGPDGSVWAVGRIEGNTQFGSVSVPSNGENDVVIVKYSADGDALWAKSGGGSGMDWGNSVAVDADGNSYMVGYFNGSATFGSSTINGRGMTDIFVSAYDPDGNLRWVRSAGSDGADEAYGVAVDTEGNVYVTGIISGNATFDNLSASGASAGSGFVARYDADGTIEWVQEIGGTNIAESISINGEDEIFVAGSFYSTLSSGTTSLSSAGSADMFVLELTTAGITSSGWRYGGTGEDGVSAFGKSLRVIAAADGGFYLGGSYSEQLDLGITTLESRGKSDIVVGRFSGDGSAIWAIDGGGTEKDHYVSIGVDSTGVAYMFGNYFSPTFRMGDVTLPRLSSNDMVMAKIDGSAATGEPSVSISRNTLAIGNVATGSAGSKSLTIRPGNGVPLQVTDITIESLDPFHPIITGSSAPGVEFPIILRGSDFLTVTVYFEPTEPGAAEATLVIATNDPSRSEVEVPVTGTGVDGSLIPRAIVSTEQIAFGEVPVETTTRRTFTIVPGTAAGLIVDEIEFENPASEDDGFAILEPTSFPQNIAGGDTLEVTIELTPTEEGNLNARLVLITNDQDDPVHNVDLTASVTEAPIALVNTTGLLFREVKVGQAGVDSIQIEAGSDAQLRIEEITLTNPNGSEVFFITRPDPTTSYPIDVPSLGPTIIAVEYRPLVEGDVTGSLLIRTNDPGAREVEISLSGTGTPTLSVPNPEAHNVRIRIEPNPVEGTGHIELSMMQRGQLSVDLLDVTGRVVAELYRGESQGAEQIALMTEGLGSGLYFCRVSIGGERYMQMVRVVR